MDPVSCLEILEMTYSSIGISTIKFVCSSGGISSLCSETEHIGNDVFNYLLVCPSGWMNVGIVFINNCLLLVD